MNSVKYDGGKIGETVVCPDLGRNRSNAFIGEGEPRSKETV